MFLKIYTFKQSVLLLASFSLTGSVVFLLRTLEALEEVLYWLLPGPLCTGVDTVEEEHPRSPVGFQLLLCCSSAPTG